MAFGHILATERAFDLNMYSGVSLGCNYSFLARSKFIELCHSVLQKMASVLQKMALTKKQNFEFLFLVLW